ncbi:MAG: TPR repeat protein [Gammaproteobacteria bacterium]|jgi:TPR repeat protein
MNQALNGQSMTKTFFPRTHFMRHGKAPTADPQFFGFTHEREKCIAHDGGQHDATHSKTRALRLLTCVAWTLAGAFATAPAYADIILTPEKPPTSANANANASASANASANPSSSVDADAGASAGSSIGAEAKYERGLAYDTGQGVPQDYERAYEFYREAAREGHLRAMLSIGLMLNEGQGTPADPTEAAGWIGRSARAGLADGQYSYGVILMQGRGVQKSYERALEWFSQAARAGHPQAMNNLGVLHANGLGTPANPVDAYAWFSLAEDAGSSDGRENRLTTEQALSSQDLDSAKQLAFDLSATVRP